MEKLNLSVPIPKIIVSLILWFVLHHRKKRFGYTFRRIKLTKYKPVGSKQGEDRYAIVDVEDYEKLTQYNWQLYEGENNKGYAVCLVNRKIVYMHRVIMNAPKGFVVDHKKYDGLDNRKENLRIVTLSQNQYNRRKTSKKTSSKYKGVYLRKQSNKYSASIGCNGKSIFLGDQAVNDEMPHGRIGNEADDVALPIVHFSVPESGCIGDESQHGHRRAIPPDPAGLVRDS